MEYRPINQSLLQKMYANGVNLFQCVAVALICFYFFSRNDVLVSCIFYEFLRKGKVSKYEKKLQDLLKEWKGFVDFYWAVEFLSQFDFNATIAQVLLSLNSFVNVVALLVNLNKSLL